MEDLNVYKEYSRHQKLQNGILWQVSHDLNVREENVEEEKMLMLKYEWQANGTTLVLKLEFHNLWESAKALCVFLASLDNEGEGL